MFRSRLLCLILKLALWFLGIPGTALGLAERADGCVAVDLLVTGQASLHGRGLLAEGRGLWALGGGEGGPAPPSRLLHLVHGCGQGRGQGGLGQLALVPLALLLLEELRLERLVLLVQLGQLGQADLQPQPIHQLLERLVLVVHLLGPVQVLVAVLLRLLDHRLHHIDVSVNLPQLFHVSHLFLQQQLHLMPVLLKTPLFIFSGLNFVAKPRLQLLHLDSASPYFLETL